MVDETSQVFQTWQVLWILIKVSLSAIGENAS